MKTSQIKDLVVIRPLNESLQNVNEQYLGAEKESVEGGGGDPLKDISSSTHSWTKVENKIFLSRKPNKTSIPAGLYDIRSSQFEGIFLESKTVTLDELFLIPNDVLDLIIDDFEKFWASKDLYEQYKFTYKRGILMFGRPGCGKTTLNNLLTKQIIEKFNGIVLNVNDLATYIPMVHNIRAVEPDRPILALIDELDSFTNYNSEKDLLNLLDGNLQVDNVIYFATTNYINRIAPRIKCRPSRFDRVLELKPPSAEARDFFFKKKLTEQDVIALGNNYQRIIKDTEGMSFAHLKELVIALVIFKEDISSTIERLKQMMNYDE